MKITIALVSAALCGAGMNVPSAAAQKKKTHRLQVKLAPASVGSIALTISVGGTYDNRGCRSCRVPVGGYRADVKVPAGYHVVRLVSTGGALSVVGIAPNGRRAVGALVFSKSDSVGHHEIGAIIAADKNPGARQLIVAPFEIEPQIGRQCRPTPCATPPGPHGCEVVPAPRCGFWRVRSSGRLRFGNQSRHHASGWPQKLGIDVGLRRGRGKRLSHARPPTVTCSTGKTKLTEYKSPGGRSHLDLAYRLEVDTTPPQGKRIASGAHHCEVVFTLARANGKTITRRGKLRFRVAGDGLISLGAERCVRRGPAPDYEPVLKCRR